MTLDGARLTADAPENVVEWVQGGHPTTPVNLVKSSEAPAESVTARDAEAVE